MKHLKYFENNKALNDWSYVILDMNKLKNDGFIEKDNLNIVDDRGLLYHLDNNDSAFPYGVEFFDGTSEYFNEDEILREMTPKEIDEHLEKIEINKNSITYNL